MAGLDPQGDSSAASWLEVSVSRVRSLRAFRQPLLLVELHREMLTGHCFWKGVNDFRSLPVR